MLVTFKSKNYTADVSALGLIVLKSRLANALSKEYGQLYEDDVMTRMHQHYRSLQQAVRIAEQYQQITTKLKQDELDAVNYLLFSPAQSNSIPYSFCINLYKVAKRLTDQNDAIGVFNNEPVRIKDFIRVMQDCVESQSNLQMIWRE